MFALRFSTQEKFMIIHKNLSIASLACSMLLLVIGPAAMQAAYGDEGSGEGGAGGGGPMHKIKLIGSFVDDAGITGRVKYDEASKNGKYSHAFDVKIANAPADTSLGLYVNENFVGMITTNADGKGRLKIKFAAHGSWEPLPGVFPTIDPGDVVKIGSANAVMGNRE
jgi:hypothetical protein